MAFALSPFLVTLQPTFSGGPGSAMDIMRITDVVQKLKSHTGNGDQWNQQIQLPNRLNLQSFHGRYSPLYFLCKGRIF